MADGEFRDIAHPINSDTRALIQKVVFDEYEKMLAEEGESGEGETSEV
jgi:stage V sporulation protein G